MTRRIVVLPSPFLPSLAYRPLADALDASGVAVEVADPTLAEGQTADDLVSRWAGLVTDTTTLVAHSNAGLLAPLVRDRADARVDTRVPIVFADAALLPESGSTRLAPAPLRDQLAGRADAGVLPPWTRWWDGADLAEVIPPALVGPIDAACPRLPLAYLDHTVTAPGRWVAAPNAYLAFGTTYVEETSAARRHGWPVDTLDGGHLHFLHEPVAVTARILRLVDQLG